MTKVRCFDHVPHNRASSTFKMNLSLLIYHQSALPGPIPRLSRLQPFSRFSRLFEKYFVCYLRSLLSRHLMSNFQSSRYFDPFCSFKCFFVLSLSTSRYCRWSFDSFKKKRWKEMFFTREMNRDFCVLCLNCSARIAVLWEFSRLVVYEAYGKRLSLICSSVLLLISRLPLTRHGARWRSSVSLLKSLIFHSSTLRNTICQFFFFIWRIFVSL